MQEEICQLSTKPARVVGNFDFNYADIISRIGHKNDWYAFVTVRGITGKLCQVEPVEYVGTKPFVTVKADVDAAAGQCTMRVKS